MDLTFGLKYIEFKIMTKYIVLACFFIASCQGETCQNLDKQSCEVLRDFTVADQNNELHFNHQCSDLDNHNGHHQAAYVFFEKTEPDEQYKALVLAEVSVGWIGYHPSAQPVFSNTEDVDPSAKGIFLNLERLQIQDLDEWAGQAFSIALQLRNQRTKQTVTGDFSTTFSYSYSGGGYPEDIKYMLPNTGDLFWEKLKEPKEDNQTEASFCFSCEEGSSTQRENEYKASSMIDINSPKIAHPEDPHSLYLILKNETTGATIELKGPVVQNLKKLLDSKYSGPRILTWQVLSPWQEGGIWDQIFDSFRYGDCIYLRRQAKKEFSLRF